MFNRKIAFLIIVFISLFLSACSTKYVCYDGEVVKDAEECPSIDQPRVIQRQAEQVVDSYSAAHAKALGVIHSRINTYREEGDWYSVVLFTDAKTGKVKSVTWRIDGMTATVTCFEGCDYFSDKDLDEKLNESLGEVSNETDDVADSGFSVY